nr:undecaprenyl/decaprenyl-phosphate alpha-N-acetylglucosaminyl 1-phosphate transferase [Candidatus Eremiobacteraeota bacterium]
MSIYLLYLAALVLAGVVSAFATPLICRLANHIGIIDQLGDERRVHEIPTPRLGGIAVYFGFAFA